jgi:hypothetical protein
MANHQLGNVARLRSGGPVARVQRVELISEIELLSKVTRFERLSIMSINSVSRADFRPSDA